MPHMLLIHEPVGQRAGRTEADGRAEYDRMVRWGADLDRRGLLLAGEALASMDHAARVSLADGKPRIIDGPFAETKEMLGGFFLLNVESREEAISLALECPAAAFATIEVRPLAPCYIP